MPTLVLAVLFHNTSFEQRVQLFGLVLPDGSRYSPSNRQNEYEEFDNRLCSK
jgi:hypothetical protein